MSWLPLGLVPVDVLVPVEDTLVVAVFAAVGLALVAVLVVAAFGAAGLELVAVLVVAAFAGVGLVWENDEDIPKV